MLFLNLQYMHGWAFMNTTKLQIQLLTVLVVLFFTVSLVLTWKNKHKILLKNIIYDSLKK